MTAKKKSVKKKVKKKVAKKVVSVKDMEDIQNSIYTHFVHNERRHKKLKSDISSLEERISKSAILINEFSVRESDMSARVEMLTKRLGEVKGELDYMCHLDRPWRRQIRKIMEKLGL